MLKMSQKNFGEILTSSSKIIDGGGPPPRIADLWGGPPLKWPLRQIHCGMWIENTTTSVLPKKKFTFE